MSKSVLHKFVTKEPTETDLKRARNEGALALMKELGWKQFRCKNHDCGQYHNISDTNVEAKYQTCPECDMLSLSQGQNCVFCGAELQNEEW